MKRLWWITPLALTLIAVTGWLLLKIPGPVGLELYDVQDLVYDMGGGFPSVDISPAGAPDDCYDPPRMIGMDLAERIAWLLPKSTDRKSDEQIEFSNGLIIARTTGIKQAAVQGIIAVHRLHDRFLIGLHSHDSDLRKAFSKLLPSGRSR